MAATSSPSTSLSNGPFLGLVICVTGFSKEARRQIMEATERFGGEYSPNLHFRCTHLLVKSLGGRKLQHAFKFRYRAGLFIVTFQWFVDCIMRNARLRESLYSVEAVRNSSHKVAESCDTVGFNNLLKPAEMIEECFQSSDMALQENTASCLTGQKMYIDSDVSAELRSKVMEAANQMGAIFMDQWLVGCGASYVVCEGSSILRYLGHADNIVTPVWVLKTAKRRCMQRFIRFSADLAREVGMLLENLREGNTAGQVSLHAISPSTLLESVCWSISEPPSTATIYNDASVAENAEEAQVSGFPDAKDDGKPVDTAFSNLSRPLSESEKTELIFRHHFITILFPVDRFSEMGLSSRTFYSEKGFACLQMLDLIYVFYQENMSDHEIEAAIHTDSRHADKLRAIYSTKRTEELMYKRIDFMGSRRFLEMLKRISGDNTGNVYELVISA